MDRIKKYFIRPWYPTIMLSHKPVSRLAWRHLQSVYNALCFGFWFALVGAFFHDIFNHGGWITAVGFILTSWWISRIKPSREIPRVILLMVAAYFFGVTLGPLINLFIEMNQSDVIKITMVGMVFSICHFATVRLTFKRDIMYKMDEFCPPIFITMWMIISETYSTMLDHALFLLVLPYQWYLSVYLLHFLRNRLPMWFTVPFHLVWMSLLCYFFDYPLSDLLFVYLLVLSLNVHLKMHSQYAIFQLLARPNTGKYYVSTTIAFFTYFPAHIVTFFMHYVGLMLGKLRTTCMRLRHLQ